MPGPFLILGLLAASLLLTAILAAVTAKRPRLPITALLAAAGAGLAATQAAGIAGPPPERRGCWRAATSRWAAPSVAMARLGVGQEPG